MDVHSTAPSGRLYRWLLQPSVHGQLSGCSGRRLRNPFGSDGCRLLTNIERLFRCIAALSDINVTDNNGLRHYERSGAVVQPAFCPVRWLPPANDRCRHPCFFRRRRRTSGPKLGFNRSTQQIGEIVQRAFRSLVFSLDAHSISWQPY